MKNLKTSRRKDGPNYKLKIPPLKVIKKARFKTPAKKYQKSTIGS